MTRVLAALVFTPVIFGLIWLGGPALAATCFVLGVVSLWEYVQLVFGAGAEQGYTKAVVYALGGLLLASKVGWLPALVEPLFQPAAALAVLICVLLRPAPLNTSMQRAALILLGVVYCAGLLPYLTQLRSFPGEGRGFALMALLCTWSSDTGAYFAGRAFGRHKLYPRISPAKTVEGGVGGLVCAVGVALLIREVLGLGLAWSHCAALGALAAVFGALGDLCESMLKRSVGAKDSSGLIPGHGGLLDRFDGVMFAVPACYIYVMVFIHAGTHP